GPRPPPSWRWKTPPRRRKAPPGDAGCSSRSNYVSAGQANCAISRYYYLPESSRCARILSCATNQGIGTCVACCQERGDRPAAGFAHEVAVRLGHLVQQAVRAQQPQLPGDGGRLAALLLGRGGLGAIQQAPQVPV